MKEFISNLSSISWWISVVIVGILINITSFYLTRKLDTRLSNVSSWWRKRSDLLKAKRLKKIGKLRSESHEQVLLAVEIVEKLARTIMLLILGLIMISLYLALRTKDSLVAIISIFIAALMVIMALTEFLRYWSTDNLFQDARNNESQDDE